MTRWRVLTTRIPSVLQLPHLAGLLGSFQPDNGRIYEGSGSWTPPQQTVRSLCWLNEVVDVGRVPKALRRNRHRKFDDPIYTYFRELDDMCHRRRKKGEQSIVPREWEQGVKMVLNNMHLMTPFRMANIINCFKRARYVDEQFFEVLVGRAYRDPSFIASFDAMQISMTVQSLAMLARDAREGECEGVAPGSFVDGESSFFTNTCLHFSKLLLQSALDDGKLVKDEFSTREISSLMHALGVFSNLVEPREIDSAAEDIVGALIESFCDKAEKIPEGKCSAQDYANMLHGCAALGYNDKTAISKILDSMESSFSKSGNFVSTQSIGNILWCLGILNVKHDKLMEVVVTRARELDSWTPRSLSDVLYGLGSLGYNDPGLVSFLANYVTVGHYIMSFSERDLANSVLGFGLLGVKDPQVVHVLGNEISRIGRAANFTNQDLTRSIWGFGLLEYENEHGLLCLGLETVDKNRLWGLKNEELAEIFLGFGRTRFCKASVHIPLLREMKNRVREVPVKDLSKTIKAMAMLSSNHLNEIKSEVQGFLQEVAAELNFRGVEQYQLGHMSEMLEALAKMRFRDEKLQESVFNSIFDQDGFVAEKVHPQAVGLILCAIAKLNCVALEETKLTRVAEYLLRNLHQLGGVDKLVDTMASFAILDLLDVATVELFVAKLMSLGMGSNYHDFEEEIWQRIMLCLTLLVDVKGAKVSSRVKSLLERSKTQSILSVPDRMGDRTCYLGELLKKREWRWTYGVNPSGLLIPVGFLLESRPLGIVETCEDYLFEGSVRRKGENMLMDDALIRHRILEGAGYEVLMIPHSSGKEETALLLDSFLSTRKSGRPSSPGLSARLISFQSKITK